MNQKVTLIIPTKNRPALLARLLSYYLKVKADFSIFIGDSSDSEFSEQVSQVISKFKNCLDIKHIYYPSSMGGTRAVVNMLPLVETPYSIFTGDDDFLILDRVKEGVHFLDCHPDYSLVGGAVGTIPIEFVNDNIFHPKSLQFFNYRSIENDSPSQRLIDFFSHPGSINNTFDLRRTEEMKNIFSKTIELGLDSDLCATQLSETGIGGASIILGKGKKLSGLYLVMLTHERRIGSACRMVTFDAMSHENWPKHLNSVINLWASYLHQKENLDSLTAERIAQIAFMINLGPRVLNHYNEIIRQDSSIAKIISIKQTSFVEKIFERLPKLPGIMEEFFRRNYGFTLKTDVCLKNILELRAKRDQNILDICDEITASH